MHLVSSNTNTSIKGSTRHRSHWMWNIQAENPQQARKPVSDAGQNRFRHGPVSPVCVCCLTFPCCLPPGSSGQAGSPCVGVWQSSVWSWTCSSAPWQSLGRPRLTWSERETTMEALFTHQHTFQSRLLRHLQPFCLYLHVWWSEVNAFIVSSESVVTGARRRNRFMNLSKFQQLYFILRCVFKEITI